MSVFNKLSNFVFFLGFTTLSQAHFQLLYTPDLSLDKPTQLTFKMPFTHPAANGVVMEVAPPIAFYQVKKGEKIDLLDKVTEITWTSAENKGKAYEAAVTVKGLGDSVFVLEPSPYFEKEEGLYIKQIVKSMVNVGGLPTDWNAELGLAAEIIPLVKPYAVYADGIFSGVVKVGGKAVPFAEIEIEFMNYQPDMTGNRFADKATVAQADIFVTQTIFADANGVFHFAMPFAGQWGFAAINLAPEADYQGKPLELGAVIWVQAHAKPN